MDQRPFVMVHSVTAKDKKDEKEKENRRRIHILKCINSGKRGDGKEEM